MPLISKRNNIADNQMRATLEPIPVCEGTVRYCVCDAADSVSRHQLRRYSRATRRRGDSLRCDEVFVKSGRGDAVVLEYGGNVCNYDWAAIAEHPGGNHEPSLSVGAFVALYRSLLSRIGAFGGAPIILSLPPLLLPHQFVMHVCSNLNGANIIRWLGGDASFIVEHYKPYDEALRDLASELNVGFIDLVPILVAHGDAASLYQPDGIHLNGDGHALVDKAIGEFKFA